ncbi:unnamed protein product [[Candida] boidinii]|nr:unnamed protein product [[Candida] boidinii]
MPPTLTQNHSQYSPQFNKNNAYSNNAEGISIYSGDLSNNYLKLPQPNSPSRFHGPGQQTMNVNHTYSMASINRSSASISDIHDPSRQQPQQQQPVQPVQQQNVDSYDDHYSSMQKAGLRETRISKQLQYQQQQKRKLRPMTSLYVNGSNLSLNSNVTGNSGLIPSPIYATHQNSSNLSLDSDTMISNLPVSNSNHPKKLPPHLQQQQHRFHQQQHQQQQHQQQQHMQMQMQQQRYRNNQSPAPQNFLQHPPNPQHQHQQYQHQHPQYRPQNGGHYQQQQMHPHPHAQASHQNEYQGEGPIFGVPSSPTRGLRKASPMYYQSRNSDISNNNNNSPNWKRNSILSQISGSNTNTNNNNSIIGDVNDIDGYSNADGNNKSVQIDSNSLDDEERYYRLLMSQNMNIEENFENDNTKNNEEIRFEI